MKRALISILSVVTLVLVSSCGASASGSSTGNSGPITVARIDGINIYRLCDAGRLIYFTSSGGVSATGSWC